MRLFFEFSILINTGEQNELNMSTYRFWHKVFKLIKALKTDFFFHSCRLYTLNFPLFYYYFPCNSFRRHRNILHRSHLPRINFIIGWIAATVAAAEKKRKQEVFGQTKTIQFVRTASPVQSSSILIRTNGSGSSINVRRENCFKKWIIILPEPICHLYFSKYTTKQLSDALVA